MLFLLDSTEYKFYVYNGKARYVHLVGGRDSSEGRTRLYLDMNWNTIGCKDTEWPTGTTNPSKPKNVKELMNKNTLEINLNTNIPNVTGASHLVSCGDIYA